MAIVEFIFILALAGTAGLFIMKATGEQQKQRRLEVAFYELLKEQDSCISLIQLAAAATVDSQLAKQYLDLQVKTFGAILEFDRDGEPFYRFPKLRLPPSLAKGDW
jgi:hypothetical protein